MKKLKNILKGIGIITFIGLALTAGFLLLKETTKIKVTSAEVVEKIREVTVDNSEEIWNNKIKELQDNLLARLQVCENRNLKVGDIGMKWDDNKAGTLPYQDKPSYGAFQFKVSTVQEFVYSRDGENISQVEALKIAIERDDALELARFTIFYTQGGIFRWRDCAEKDNNSILREVEIIKSMEE